MGIANNGVYAKAPFTSGLANPMGTFTTEKKRFDGNPFNNLGWAARAYTMDILGSASPDLGFQSEGFASQSGQSPEIPQSESERQSLSGTPGGRAARLNKAPGPLVDSLIPR